MGGGGEGGGGSCGSGVVRGVYKGSTGKNNNLSSSLTLLVFLSSWDCDLNRETLPIFSFCSLPIWIWICFCFFVFCITASHLLDFNCNQGYFKDLLNIHVINLIFTKN